MSLETEVRDLHKKLDVTEASVSAIAGKLDTQTEIMKRVEAKQDQTNGAVADVKRDQIVAELKQAETRGGLGMLKWLIGIVMIPLVIGAAGLVAALIFALVT